MYVRKLDIVRREGEAKSFCYKIKKGLEFYSVHGPPPSKRYGELVRGLGSLIASDRVRRRTRVVGWEPRPQACPCEEADANHKPGSRCAEIRLRARQPARRRR
ncbi:hypothetical protein NDU88_002858 [Pleurodeles waltl]|uniref:Uncharacterized protein n=1 Tax=Pleurodeles waltl TaxID=8319 RepID=A0AAV7WPT7_PLEWA|nr:hypothetical protein NDU88_002858 [Pleurodeles waltl]